MLFLKGKQNNEQLVFATQMNWLGFSYFFNSNQ